MSAGTDDSIIQRKAFALVIVAAPFLYQLPDIQKLFIGNSR